MIVDRRLLACAVLSVGTHVAFARAMRHLPQHADGPAKRIVSIRVVSPPPAAEPPPEPPNAPSTPKPKAAPIERARPRHAPEVAREVAPRDVPPPDHPPAPSDATGGPVFGVSMESTSVGGGGPAMPVGDPSNPGGAHAGGRHEPKGGADRAPVPAYEVTTMPLPLGRCVGKYTDEAKQAAVEGTVVLALVVGADGRVREVRVVSGLGHGLTEAAVAAAKACRFSPGQKGELAVPVLIREFKIRFLLQEDE